MQVLALVYFYLLHSFCLKSFKNLNNLKTSQQPFKKYKLVRDFSELYGLNYFYLRGVRAT